MALWGNGKGRIKMGRREDECGGRRGLGDTDLSLGGRKYLGMATSSLLKCILS